LDIARTSVADGEAASMLSNRARGIIFMVLSAVIFALMAALVRGVSVNPYTMVMVRFVIGTLVCLAIFATGRDRPRWSGRFRAIGRLHSRTPGEKNGNDRRIVFFYS
jgi:drug/metabolite transporter (DMT)-like permease